jgi:type II secretion system protein N
MPESRAELAAPAPRTWLIRSGYAAFGLALFVAFVIASFPYSATLSNLLTPMGMQISIGDQHLDFPFGAKLQDVRVTSIPAGAWVFESPAISVTPSFLSLLMFHLGVHLKADLYGGLGKLTARPSGDGTSLDFNLRAVDLSRQHLYQLPGLTLSGILSASGDFWISQHDFQKNTGSGDLTFSGLFVKTLIVPVRLERALANYTLDHGTLTVKSFKTLGGELIIDASGTIQIGPDADSTVLALEFTLTPSPAAADRFRFLQAIMPPHPPGSPYHMTGTLNAPQIR